MEYNPNNLAEDIGKLTGGLSETISQLQNLLNNSKSLLTEEQQAELNKSISEAKFNDVQSDLIKVSELINNIKK